MPDLLSPSAIKRLPTAIRRLGEKERMAFVFLRMKRDESYIARELKITISQAREMIHLVQNTLVQSGALDMIQDPVFFPIDHPHGDSDGEERSFELPGANMDIADELFLDGFYKILSKSLDEMDTEGRRLMGLWFNKEMKAKAILIFYKNLGIPISSKKPIEKTTEQDVFYELEKNIRKLLVYVRSNVNDSEIDLTPAALRAILNETGV
ncbi:hypothetical protein MNBD_NITROSPINAE02-34 [hydrothermal vent metagenome]|uniref:Uncharacterized protein n=1 Tax=hydrothermal vent metagenome TaxID=652676 RepID=A0A3B1C0I5_9ZZZZ